MRMKNTAPHPVTVTSDVAHDSVWEGTTGARPRTFSIPAGAVVEIRDEYALRRRASWGTNEDTPPMVMPSAVEQLSGGHLKPDGVDAIDLYEHTFHDQLASVQREFAEMQRRSKAEAADRWVTREAMEAEIEAKVKAAVAAVVPPTPEAQPRFITEPKLPAAK